jgi:hypothetical protein
VDSSILFLTFSLSVYSQTYHPDYTGEKIERYKLNAKVKQVFIPLEIGEIIPKGWILDWATSAANGQGFGRIVPILNEKSVECSGSKGLRASNLSSYAKIDAGQNARIPWKPLLKVTLFVMRSCFLLNLNKLSEIRTRLF